MLIEIHILQNHSPSNLNRDDTGSPKEAVFGGWKRGRISSQCLKRSIRRSDIFQKEMQGCLANRTRRLPELVREKLVAGGLSADLADLAAKKASGFGTAAGSEQSADKNNTYATAQTMFLTDADVVAVSEVLKEAALAAKSTKEFESVKASDLQASAQLRGYRPITVDIALFGRMVTSGAFRDAEASAQIAHAISTHKVEHEYDYFTAVDDLKSGDDKEEDAGADMIGDVEFNSACYYKYFSIDFDGLVANLTGESAGRKDVSANERTGATSLAARAVDALLKSAILTTPSGKQNTFAAHQLPATVLVEVRPCNTPVSYANAFVDPARQTSSVSLVQNSIEKLAKHMSALTIGFNLDANARFILAPECETFPTNGVEVARVPDLAALGVQLKAVITNG
jgi:CRISPR system Cascade subunit CasC